MEIQKAEQRIDKWLSNLGYCSRAQARSWIQQHMVCCGDRRIIRPDEKTRAHALTIDGQPLDHPFGLTLLMNKPSDVVCSHDKREGKTVYDLLPERWQNRHPSLQTVGRLDKDTTGVLILTDCLPWVHELTHPKKKVVKSYLVEYEGTLPKNAKEVLESGSLVLPGEKEPCLEASLMCLEAGRARLKIREGRYHQVKRMFAALGVVVVRLHRESFGSLELEGLEPGFWRVLDLNIVKNMFRLF